MTEEDILRLRDTAEQTRVQFKERVTRDNKYDVSSEMVAQSNSHGGLIVVGIDDKTGRINPLSFVEVQETTNLLGSLASEGVVPQILIETETVSVDGGNLVVVTFKRKVDSNNKETNQEKKPITNQAANQVTNQVTNQVRTSRHPLTKEEKDIVNYCSVPRSAQEILDRVGVSVQTRTRKKYILSLVEIGVIEMTNPDNPTDPNQKYRKVRRG